MDARQMLAKLDGYGGIIPFNSEELEVTLRALRLLAAAEANDGSTPETDANLIPGEHDDLGSIECVAADLARRLERERTGLAARVLELELDAERLEWVERLLFDKHWNGVIDSGSKTTWRIVESHRHTTHKMVGHTFRAAIDAARSKP